MINYTEKLLLKSISSPKYYKESPLWFTRDIINSCDYKVILLFQPIVQIILRLLYSLLANIIKIYTKVISDLPG